MPKTTEQLISPASDFMYALEAYGTDGKRIPVGGVILVADKEGAVHLLIETPDIKKELKENQKIKALAALGIDRVCYMNFNFLLNTEEFFTRK
ncbi:hypothetical protein H6G80_28490 [Nostoc sp. FACHB-87]|uniref:hypothetical protein n=1 Tax=Nostocaceae TaxID=1162 RepID=UPI001689891A|nr:MULTISPECIES: hypothetical protein [Nostocaceae]MBD2457991.1 hypothetical protein [Nostoc sp. FACHB-87]MBD2479232.1 hypothetical protein [Anabaena sp. FACHB-83]